MKADLEGLKLTNSELEELTGVQNLCTDVEQCIQLYLVYEKLPDVFANLPTNNLVIRPSMFDDPEFRDHFFQKLCQKSLGKKGWLGKGVNKLTKTIEKRVDKYFHYLQATPLGILLDEVDNYNTVIEEIAFVDQLQEAGNPVKVQDRQSIMERLHQIRAELVRALKTERLFRENPHMTMNDLSFNLYSWQRLELDEQAQKYERFVNEALEIGVKVWKDIQTWYLVEENQP